MNDVRMAAYEAAVSAQDEEQAANMARIIRDRMLADSDKFATVDRPSSEAWLNYRQALRDLPDQEGFPFNVTFPEAPESEAVGETMIDRVSAISDDNMTALEGIAELYEMVAGGN